MNIIVTLSVLLASCSLAHADTKPKCYQIHITPERYSDDTIVCKKLANYDTGLQLRDCALTDGWISYHLDVVHNPSNILEVDCAYEPIK